MTATTSTPKSITTSTHSDPHGLGASGAALADEPELRTRFGVSGKWLRHVRRFRLARYLDMRPDEKPGVGAPTRFLYCLRDIVAVREAERARIDAAREAQRARVEAAAVPPPASPASPGPPSPIPLPRPPPPFVPRPAAKTTAKVRGKAPEVVYMRRAGGTRS